MLYPAKLSIKIKGEIKSFHGKQKSKEFINTNSALQKIFKGILHTEEEDEHNQDNMGKE
jgi:hypothetical protein